MASTGFQTNTMNFRQLFGNGTTYAVPPFQRDYAWGRDEWDDLWQDLLAAIGGGDEPGHYMGYVVLQQVTSKDFEVIDGQQRLTTITLITLAALAQLKRIGERPDDDGRAKQRADALYQSYIGYRDPVSLVARSKLKLNRNNDGFFTNWLLSMREPLPQRGLKASEKRLRDAFVYFQSKIDDFVRDQIDQGEAIARLVDQMSLSLVFTVITVTDELNAYTVFETINARGVKLSSTDLLKNYLFSLLHRGGADENEMSALEIRWEKLLNDLENDSFPAFVRAHWISQHGLVRESELYKAIRVKVRDRASAFSLLNGMESDLENYLSLSRPESSYWPSTDKKAAGLLRLFNVRQPFPILMAAKRRFSPLEFSAFISSMVLLTFRYNVIANGQSSDLETAFAAEAVRIERGETSTARQALLGLRGVYIPDDRFKIDFADVSFDTSRTPKRKLVRYILGELELRAGGTPTDLENEAVSLEHICPVRPGEGWDAFTDNEVQSLAMRLGNMTLFESGANRSAQNAPYSAKKQAYLSSSYAMTRALPESYPEWTPATLESRQQAMARQATAIWRISQFDQSPQR